MAITKKAAPAKPVSEKAAPAAAVRRKVACDGFNALNVRKSPSMTAQVIRTLKNGEIVSAEPARRGWCKLADGGYVRSNYLV